MDPMQFLKSCNYIESLLGIETRKVRGDRS